MRIRRILLLSSLACVVAAGSVRADTTWQTIRLDGQSDFIIDIPAVVADDYKPSASNKDELMFFSVEIDDLGSMLCYMMQFRYTPDLTREKMLAGIASGNAETFCKEEGATISGWELNDSGKTVVDGEPAGTCSAAYTDSSNSDGKGNVEAAMVVAGQTRAYLLTCQNSREDKDKAISAYVLHWEDEVEHIQQSLHLPAAER